MPAHCQRPGGATSQDRSLHAMRPMRLVAGAVVLALFASVARADDPATSESPRSAPASPAPAQKRPAPSAAGAHGKLPLRVVRVMPESHQALLYDRSRATHVLAEVGGQVSGYIVDDIDEESVTLRRGRQQIVLAAPPRAAPRSDAGSPSVRPPAAIGQPAAPPVRSSAATGAPAAPTAHPATTEAPAAPTAHPATTEAPAAPTAHPATTEAPAAPTAHPATVDASTSPAARPVTTDARAGAEPSPQDPYVSAPASDAASAPADPYADPPVRSVESPDAPSPTGDGATAAESGEPGVRVAHAPGTPGVPPAAAVVPGDGGVRVAQAPSARSSGGESAAAPADASGGPPVRVVEAPSAAAASPATTAPPATASPAATAPPATASPAATAPPASASAATTPTADVRVASAATAAAPAAPDAAAAPATISRVELDRALANFAALTAAVRARFSAAGVVVDSVGDGTIFQRAGLRAGDVIASVDGAPLRSLDDAANVYARAATAKAITAQVMRGGKPVTLRVAIR